MGVTVRASEEAGVAWDFTTNLPGLAEKGELFRTEVLVVVGVTCFIFSRKVRENPREEGEMGVLVGRVLRWEVVEENVGGAEADMFVF